ncbi:MAG: hypothetical protein CVV47_00760 [Spirochaetae bacterium HGW-Spirochaetae-3]|jgi:hypothetical protein|nr:MAG: hypothetical protein CVV47_00760 [Spirochaetae bacterium HGW-Spirochaetae-3]
MNPYALVALVLLAVAATAQYYIGTKKNRVITSNMSRDLEALLKPTNTNYVNIGGTIGYNFAYALSGDWTKAKGTFTVNARHSLLYFPLSRLMGIRDRFFINLFTKKKLLGEAHIVNANFLRKANIDGVESMQRRGAEAGGKRFVLLWRDKDLSAEMERMLLSLAEPSRLRHFCSFPETKTFFVHSLPKDGMIKDDMAAILRQLPAFIDGGKS